MAGVCHDRTERNQHKPLFQLSLGSLQGEGGGGDSLSFFTAAVPYSMDLRGPKQYPMVGNF